MPRKSPILVLSKKRKISITDLAKYLEVSSKMLYRYMQTPGLFHLKDIIIMSGLFEVKPSELFDLLIINRSEERKSKQENESSIKTA